MAPGTACWPCRQRKVKCDNKQPCENCVKRDHPQLCSYKPNRSSTSKASNSGLADGPTARKRARSFSDAHDARRRAERQESWPRAIGTKPSIGPFAVRVADPYPESLDEGDVAADRYLGQNSIPALLRDQSPSDKNDRIDIRQDMRPILGLDTSAPFPLMSSSHLQLLTQDISSELPSDREVMRYVTLA